MILDREEIRLRRQLAELQRRYNEEAKPIVDQLLAIEALKPLPLAIIELSDENKARLLEYLAKSGAIKGVEKAETATSTEPNWPVESEKFRKDAAGKGMCLDRLPGGFYKDQKTQHAWADWILLAARRPQP